MITVENLSFTYRKSMKMEKWDLYNAKREKSGITVCRGEIIPKGLYHLSVSAWIVNQQGQYLLSQRHPKKQYPLYWKCTGWFCTFRGNQLARSNPRGKRRIRNTAYSRK